MVWGEGDEKLFFLHSFSPSLLFFLGSSSTAVRTWREKGQELRVAGIYELRVQAAFGRGWGEGGSFCQNNI